MERDNLKSAEYNLSSSRLGEETDVESKKKKRKKALSAEDKVKAELSEDKTVEAQAKPAETMETWWRRSRKAAKLTDQKAAESQSETAETTSNEQLDQLSTTEIKEVAEDFLTARRQEIAHELIEQSSDPEAENEAQAALAADTYLAAIENKLQVDPDMTVAEATNEAYQETVQTFAPEHFMTDSQANQEEPSDVKAGDGGQSQPPSWSRYELPPDSLYPTYTKSPNLITKSEITPEDAKATERIAAVRGLLLGGIIGYLIGRRRGRVKSERQLIPIQKKLEREVLALRNSIAVKETQLRQLVQEKVKLTEPEKVTTIPSTRPINETIAYNRNPPAEQLDRTDREQTASSQPEALNQKSIKKEALDRNQLLEISEKIIVGATTLRRVYETGLISERGLRRVVEEYSKGGEVQAVLTEEMLLKERGYELDPLYRDRLPKSVPSVPVSSVQPSETPSAYTPSLAKLPIMTDYPEANLPSAPLAPVRAHPVPPLLITANIVALLILAILLIILLFVR